MKILLKYGAKVNMQTHKGRTVLMLAVIQGQAKVWKYLVTQGADANLLHDTRQRNGINSGSDYTNLMISRYLSHTWDDTCLHKAVREGLPMVIRKLVLEKNFDVNTTGKDGWTALHLAAFMNRAECIVELLELDANRDLLTNKDHFTSMHLACSKGNKEAVDMLLLTKHNLLEGESKYDRFRSSVKSLSNNMNPPLTIGEQGTRRPTRLLHKR